MDSQRHDGEATVSPYQVGATLQLKINESFSDLPTSKTVLATITKIFSMTMQPVVRVTIPTPSGTDLCAVLKLYDRRCGSINRNIGGRALQHTEDAEAAYQSFARSGEMEVFLDNLMEVNKSSAFPTNASEFYDDDSPQSLARFEAALWLQSNEYFDYEVKAYAHLHDLQGRSIPRLYALASLDLTSGGNYNIPEDLRHGPLSIYFETKAILLEYITGPILYDFVFSDLCCLSADPTQTCQTIVQEAVDMVHEISCRGLILSDCSPFNVVVDERTQRAVLIDFALCVFRDEKIHRDINIVHYNKEPDWDPDVSYWDCVFCIDNPGAIGSVMALRCEQEKGMKIIITYPDSEKIRQGFIDKVNRWDGTRYVL